MTVLNMPSISGHAGPIADFIEQSIEQSYVALQEPYALGFSRGAFQNLHETFVECSFKGWDGENAVPISSDVLRNARMFIESLPLGIKSPKIDAEPDGAITLEWYKSPRRVLSISINSDGQICYAALLGTYRRYGTDPGIGGGISEDLLQLINQIVNAQ